jgi:tRNA A-37 threonylcarbamoyl transferase component Bud32
MLPSRPELHDAALEPLRYKPERRFVAAIEGENGQRALVKAYAGGWQRASAAAKGIASAGALRVPERLGRSRRRQVVVLEWLPGRALSELAGATDHPPDGLADAARRAGEAAAELHGRRPRHLREPDVSDGERLRAAAEAAAGCCPELTGRLERLAERLAPALAPASGAAIHGDLAADQVIVGADGQVAIVDLDQAAIGDPAADLAGFAAAAEHDVVAGRLDAARRDALLDGFAAGYESASGRPGRAPGRRVAASLVRLAPEPFRRRDAGWPALTRALVERAEELAHG